MTLEEWLGDVHYDANSVSIWNRASSTRFGEKIQQPVCDVRGWSLIRMVIPDETEAINFQDGVGRFIAEAIREKIERGRAENDEAFYLKSAKSAIESFGFKEVQPGLFEKKVKRGLWVTYWIQLNYGIRQGSPTVRIGQDVMTHEDVLFAGKIKDLTELKTLFRQIGIEGERHN
jgi:hypothetical protein